MLKAFDSVCPNIAKNHLANDKQAPDKIIRQKMKQFLNL